MSDAKFTKGDWVYLRWNDPRKIHNIGRIEEIKGGGMCRIEWSFPRERGKGPREKQAYSNSLKRVSPLFLLAHGIA